MVLIAHCSHTAGSSIRMEAANPAATPDVPGPGGGNRVLMTGRTPVVTGVFIGDQERPAVDRQHHPYPWRHPRAPRHAPPPRPSGRCPRSEDSRCHRRHCSGTALATRSARSNTVTSDAPTSPTPAAGGSPTPPKRSSTISPRPSSNRFDGSTPHAAAELGATTAIQTPPGHVLAAITAEPPPASPASPSTTPA